jgi:hypothetical protein
VTVLYITVQGRTDIELFNFLSLISRGVGAI